MAQLIIAEYSADAGLGNQFSQSPRVLVSPLLRLPVEPGSRPERTGPRPARAIAAPCRWRPRDWHGSGPRRHVIWRARAFARLLHAAAISSLRPASSQMYPGAAPLMQCPEVVEEWLPQGWPQAVLPLEAVMEVREISQEKVSIGMAGYAISF